MALIKSYGNYVLQQKHQITNQGTIFERDYSTVGGIGEGFGSNQITYRQGTFVYEVNNEIVTTKLYNSNEWVKNGEDDIWTQENVSPIAQSSNSLDIILKQDSYKLKDFAYYGSCAELVRSSIIDIINNFPGELCVLEDYIITDSEDENIINPLDETKCLRVIDNPFNLNMHTPPSLLTIDEQEDIKYILSNYEKYDFIDKNNVLHDINNITFTEISGKCVSDFFGMIICNVEGQGEITLFAYYDEQGNELYLVSEDVNKFQIRPKQCYYEEFMRNLDSFQKVLLNENSKPQYSAIFEVMEENEYGYRTFFKKFTFPIGEGDYNLDISSDLYNKYVESLSFYASFYDEIYCNNLYRNMTHESIKNFDWSDVLQRENETKGDYLENARKVEKLLLLCGREIDEIKFYIDGIKNANNITYNDANNIPDYFLTDTLNVEGWEIKNIFPFKYENSNWGEDIVSTVKPYGNVKYGTCDSIVPNPNGYFSGYWHSDCLQTRNENSDLVAKSYTTDLKGFLREKIIQYINEKNYSMQELNNKFMKYLKMNSRSILQKKGTIDAIESLLSLFGLRSKKWFDSLEQDTQQRLINEMNVTYDYELTEHVAITKPLEERNTVANTINNLPKKPHLLDFFNTTKKIAYNTKEAKNGIHTPYQGLPVRYYDLANEKRLLYPYFSYNIPIDGKPYYQMNGGWLHKHIKWNETSIEEKTLEIPTNENGGFVDTNTQIPVVDNVKELLKIREDVLYDGIIYYVKNIKGYYICVNDEIYDIHEDMFDRYFEVPINNGVIEIGSQTWYGTIETYSNKIVETITSGVSTYQETKEIITVDLSKYKNGSLFKIFIKNDNSVLVKQDERILVNYAIFKDGLMETIENYTNNSSKTTNYFVLNEKKWKGMLGFWGWNQLLNDDARYKTVINLKRDYSGNNPHINGFKYDDGIEYLYFFKNLFKYATEKELFNPNCFQNVREYVASMNYIENNVGFTNLIEGNACEKRIKLYPDKKIHHFCDYLTKDNKIKYFHEFSDNFTHLDCINGNREGGTGVFKLPTKFPIGSEISIYCQEIQYHNDYVNPISGATILLWFDGDSNLSNSAVTYETTTLNFGVNEPLINYTIPSGEFILVQSDDDKSNGGERCYVRNNEVVYRRKTYNVSGESNNRYVKIGDTEYDLFTSNSDCGGIKVFLYGDLNGVDKKIRLQINKNTDNTYYSFYDIDAYSSLIKNDSTLRDIGLEKTTCLDQIINLKNITLTFYPYCNDNAIELSKNIKYFEEIILHYLSQILPSNVILNIEIGDKPSSTTLTIENG